MRRIRFRNRGGFTLIEAAVATAVIGIALVSLLVAVGSGTQTNHAGTQLTQAILLSQDIREWTVTLPFSDGDPEDQANPPGPDANDPENSADDLDDLISVTYCPPRDGQGGVISDLARWSQQIALTWRDPNGLTTVVTPGTSDVIHVNLVVSCNGRPVLETNWLVTRGIRQ